MKESVNTVVEPLVKDIIKSRPKDIIKFIFEYSKSRLRPDDNLPTDEEENTEQEKEFLKKLEENKNKKQKNKISRQGISAEAFGTFNKKA